RGTRVAGQLHLRVEPLAEAHVAAGSRTSLVDNVARERKACGEVLARGGSVVQLEPLSGVRDGERPGLSDRVVRDGGVDGRRIDTRCSRLQKEAGTVRAPLVHLVVVDLDRQVATAVRLHVERGVVAARARVGDARGADRVVAE